MGVKPRILCLHGFRGTAAILQRQLAAVRDTLESEADLVYLDAPTLATGGFGWWRAVTDTDSEDAEDPGVLGLPRTIYKGWKQSLDSIVRTIKDQGPFDGVLGFSQGGALAGIAAALSANKRDSHAWSELDFQFALVFGGFPAADPSILEFYPTDAGIDIPSLHVIGRSDSIVPPERTLALARKFVDPEIVYHEDGHVIPSTPEVMVSLRNFLQFGKT